MIIATTRSWFFVYDAKGTALAAFPNHELAEGHRTRFGPDFGPDTWEIREQLVTF